MRDNPAPLLLLTRPDADAEAMARDFTDRATCIVAPLIGIEATGAAVDLSGVTGLILTSRNAVPFVPPSGLPAFVVGPETARLAGARGLDVRVTARDAEDLVARLTADPPPGPLLHLRGDNARGGIEERLSSAGTETHSTIVYRATLRDLSAAARVTLQGERRVILPLFSPRTARQFRDTAPRGGAPVDAICLSPAVAEALGDWPVARLEIVARPDGAHMARAIDARIAATALLEGGRGAH